MLDGDLFALRPGGAGDPAAEPAPAVGPAPSPMAAATSETPGPRIARVGASAGIAIGCHIVLAVIFVALWRSMVRDVSAPDPIPVEVVSAIPEVVPKSDKPDKPAATPVPKPEPPPPPAAKADPVPPPSAPAPSSPPARPSVLDQAIAPHLAPPPPEARAAASQSAVNQAGNTAKAPPKIGPSPSGSPDAERPPQEAASPTAPPVLSAREAASSVPMPAPETPKAETPKPPTTGDPTAASQPSATLAAALPMSGLPMPASFRAALSAFGSADDAEYRGSVFGALSRAQQTVNDEARARHLAGQVVLAITLSDTGAIAALRIIQSSGSPAADAFALAMVRKAAPFPPPPPGASRTFTPAIAFGAS